MRNLKAITKKNIELHAAKVSDISEFIEKLSSESDEVTIASIRDENRKKIKTFDSDLGDAGEVLDKKPEEEVEALENESEVIKFSTAVVADAIKLGVSVGTSKSNLAKARRNLRKILTRKKTDNV